MARYVIRFDDLCPSMNWNNWEQAEKILIDNNVKPILAVIPKYPDDAQAQGAKPPAIFWERVRAWQARGWTIALHGYEHRHLSDDSGIMGINRASEFAGVPAERQREMLRKGLDIFRKERVRAQAWIAPYHSFDEATLISLKEMGVPVVSDGFSLYPYVDERRLTWVPQQLWRFRRLPFGIWTVCHHSDSWKERDVVAFSSDIRAYKDFLLSFDDAVRLYAGRRHSLADAVFDKIFRVLLAAKKAGRNRADPESKDRLNPSQVKA